MHVAKKTHNVPLLFLREVKEGAVSLVRLCCVHRCSNICGRKFSKKSGPKSICCVTHWEVISKIWPLQRSLGSSVAVAYPNSHKYSVLCSDMINAQERWLLENDVPGSSVEVALPCSWDDIRISQCPRTSGSRTMELTSLQNFWLLRIRTWSDAPPSTCVKSLLTKAYVCLEGRGGRVECVCVCARVYIHMFTYSVFVCVKYSHVCTYMYVPIYTSTYWWVSVDLFSSKKLIISTTCRTCTDMCALLNVLLIIFIIL